MIAKEFWKPIKNSLLNNMTAKKPVCSKETEAGDLKTGKGSLYSDLAGDNV